MNILELSGNRWFGFAQTAGLSAPAPAPEEGFPRADVDYDRGPSMVIWTLGAEQSVETDLGLSQSGTERQSSAMPVTLCAAS